MIQVFLWKISAWLYLLLWYVKNVVGFMLATRLGENGCKRWRISGMQDVFHAGTKGYSHLYTHCKSQNVVLDVHIFSTNMQVTMKRTYISMSWLPALRWTAYILGQSQTYKPGNTTVKIWFWCLSFLFCSTLKEPLCIICITSHSHLGHLHWFYSF